MLRDRHQSEKYRTALKYALRVLSLLIYVMKNSQKRRSAWETRLARLVPHRAFIFLASISHFV